MKSKSLLLSLIVGMIFSSCQQLSKWLDITPNETFTTFVKKGQYCEINLKTQVIGSNNLAIKQFHQEILQKNTQFDFFTKAVLLGLFQLDTRPDQTAPDSRFQIFIYDGNRWQYRDFNDVMDSPAEKSNPYIDGLRWISSQTKEKKSLESIARQLDSVIPKYVFVGPELAKWLDSNKFTFMKFDVFREHYFKGDQIVVYGESVLSLKHASLIKKYSSSRIKANIIDSLPFSQTTKGTDVTHSCNFDQKLYENMIFSKNDPKRINANVFGLQDSQGRVFIGISSLKNPKLNPESDQFLLEAENPLRPVPFCILERDKDLFALAGNQGIDPAQHLVQLQSLSLETSEGLPGLEQRLMQARSLFLVNPARVAVETQLISERELAELHHYNIPVYHADQLGEVWSWMKSYGSSGFVADPRFERGVLCLP